MGHIVQVIKNMNSSINRAVTLAHRLQAAGHRVTLLSPADLRQRMSAEGLKFEQLRGDQQVREDWLRRSRRLHPIRRLLARRRTRRASLANPEIEQVIRRLMPDLLLIDLELHYVVIASAGLGIPTAVIESWYGIFERPGLPPTHTEIIPDGTAQTQSRIQQAWAELRQAKRRQRIRRRFSPSRLRTAGRAVRYQTMDLAELKAVARVHGFDFKRETDLDAWPIPMAYRRLPVLSCCAWDLEFPHDPHPLMRYLGPLVQSERKETSVSPDSMALWNDFQSKRRVEGQPDRPLLYCSLGTFWVSDLDFLKRIVMVLERHPEWDLVLGLGSKVDPTQLSALPSNVLALDFAPQLAVLKQAQCMVTHGGSTTLNECIHFGVPMLMYSTGHGDQNGNAARVVYHGLGLLGDRTQDDATAIEHRLLRILGDTRLRHRMDEMQARFRAYAADGAAVRLIEQLMSEPAGAQTDPG